MILPEEDRAEALAKAHFHWRGNCGEEGEEDIGDVRPGYSGEYLLSKVYKALAGTSSSSAPGPDGISYGLIKLANKSTLGVNLMKEVYSFGA